MSELSLRDRCALSLFYSVCGTGWICLIVLEMDTLARYNYKTVSFSSQDYAAYVFIIALLVTHYLGAIVAMFSLCCGICATIDSAAKSMLFVMMCVYATIPSGVSCAVIYFNFIDDMHQPLVECMYAEMIYFFCTLPISILFICMTIQANR